MPFYNPSLEEMSKEVLAWDLYAMLEGRAMYTLQDVPVRFSSVDQYLDVFEPLLLEECRAQTLRSLHESDGREHQVQLTSVEPLEPFRIIHFEAPAESSTKGLYFDTDLVFVSHEPLEVEAMESGGREEVGRLEGQQFHALALVNASSPGTLALKLYLPEEPTCRLPPSQHRRLQMLRKVMVPASGKWWVRKLGNMVTINREFQALYSLRELALAQKLLGPGGGDGAAPPPSLQPPPTLLKAIESTHNPSQLLAIRTCLCGRGVTLIQGPPGTGKTKTILGILSVLLASESTRPGEKAGAGTEKFPAWPFEKQGGGSGKRAKPAGAQAAADAKAAADDDDDAKTAPWLNGTRALLSTASPWMQAGRRPAGAEDADGIGAQVGDGIWGTSAVSLTKPALGASSADAPDTSTLPAHPFPNASLSDNLFHLGRAHAEEPPKHVLVCAPSNAAIDEIVSRLLQHSG